MKRPRIDDSDGGNQLPVPVIQHIQSFLGGKQAARTSVVSKSWYNAWLTRPNLYFSESSFDGCRPSQFWDFVNKTMQRYEESNLNIESFKLGLVNFQGPGSLSNTNELIKKLLRLCVDGADCKFKFIQSGPPCNGYTLSSEVFEAETIVRLCVFGCNIGRPVIQKFKCAGFKSIRLEDIHMDGNLFWDTFPCLEDLTLMCCHGYKELEISSTSLKYISIEESRIITAKFNVPNICKLIFSGSNTPLLSLLEAPREWESEILLKYVHYKVNKSWFSKLKNLLRRLSLSMCKVSLSIGFYDQNGVRHKGDCRSWMSPDVENLMVSLSSPFFGYDALLLTLFSTCHPKFITQYWFPESCIEGKVNNKLLKSLCKRLLTEGKMHDNLSYPLTEAKVEIFDETHAKWQPWLWKSLLNGSKGPERKKTIRFQLKWWW